MKLEKICEKMHFNEIGKPGTVVECIIGNKYVSPPLKICAGRNVGNFIVLEGKEKRGGFFASRFKKANI